MPWCVSTCTRSGCDQVPQEVPRKRVVGHDRPPPPGRSGRGQTGTSTLTTRACQTHCQGAAGGLWRTSASLPVAENGGMSQTPPASPQWPAADSSAEERGEHQAG